MRSGSFQNASRSNRSNKSGGKAVRRFSAPEQPGDRDWMRVGEPTSYSIIRFVRDELRGVLYTLTGDGSVGRMKE